MSEPLSSWTDGAAKAAVLDFVERASADVPQQERVAVFDNDGTLWCEKPLPIQADVILRRLFQMAEADPACGIPRDRVIGSATVLEYTTDDRGGSIVRKPDADYLDDGPQKPVRICDIQMLDFTQHADRPFLRLLVLHDDAEREVAYSAGAEDALERARLESWTVASIANDWATVFV